MPYHTDQLHRSIELPALPSRIISIVPSQTELLHDLGLNEQVAGITKFCIHPAHWFRDKTRIGGTKKLDLEKIRQLHPDLIIANKEENDQSQIETLMQEFPVWISDVNTLDSAIDMIHRIGMLTGKKEKTVEITKAIQDRFKALKGEIDAGIFPGNLATAYFIWRDPWMVAGGDTFIHDMLRRCGLKNIFEPMPRYPQIIPGNQPAGKCQLILLSSEPYPFTEKHIAEVKAKIPAAKIILVDGEMFSWYGSRLLKAPDYFRALLNNIATVE